MHHQSGPAKKNGRRLPGGLLRERDWNGISVAALASLPLMPTNVPPLWRLFMRRLLRQEFFELRTLASSDDAISAAVKRICPKEAGDRTASVNTSRRRSRASISAVSNAMQGIIVISILLYFLVPCSLVLGCWSCLGSI